MPQYKENQTSLQQDHLFCLSPNWTEHDELPVVKAAITTWRFVPPLLIVLGTLGNVLIVAVFIHSCRRRQPTRVYFCALAVSDLLGLYVGLGPEWIRHVFPEKNLSRGNFMCKVLPWVTYSVLDYSAWILVAVTIERVVATYFPFHVKNVCNRKFALVFLITCGGVLLVINSHFLYGSIYVEEKMEFGLKCTCGDYPASYHHFFTRIWPWIDITIYCIIPMAVIIIGNLFIIAHLSLQSRRRSVISSVESSVQSRDPRRRPRRRSSSVPALTLTLLLINSAFIISTLPVSTFDLTDSTTSLEDLSIELWWAVSYNCMYLNNTFNVILYLLSGTKFRHEVNTLFRMVRRCCCRRRCPGIGRSVDSRSEWQLSWPHSRRTTNTFSLRKTSGRESQNAVAE